MLPDLLLAGHEDKNAALALQHTRNNVDLYVLIIFVLLFYYLFIIKGSSLIGMAHFSLVQSLKWPSSPQHKLFIGY